MNDCQRAKTNILLQHVVGGPNSGLEDGVFAEARFFNPQGVAWRKDVVYVADADNHCIRQVNRPLSVPAGP